MTGPARLTAGWRRSGGSATLGEHQDCYGPLPGRARPGTLARAVAEAGLTGRGGAGFPTGIKLRAVGERRGRAVVVANGMEGEPASEKDQALLSRAPHLVLDGAVLAAEDVGADVVHVCLPRTGPGWPTWCGRPSPTGTGVSLCSLGAAPAVIRTARYGWPPPRWRLSRPTSRPTPATARAPRRWPARPARQSCRFRTPRPARDGRKERGIDRPPGP